MTKFSYKVLCERYKKLREENFSLLKENFKISKEYRKIEREVIKLREENENLRDFRNKFIFLLLKFSFKYFPAIAIPTEVANPCPKTPVVHSIL